jgi:hypothetical protein
VVEIFIILISDAIMLSHELLSGISSSSLCKMRSLRFIFSDGQTKYSEYYVTFGQSLADCFNFQPVFEQLLPLISYCST